MKLKQLKLHELNKKELTKRQMNQLLGGQNCGCGCNGPSSSTDNAYANWNGGYSQSYGGNNYCASWGDSSWGSGW